MTGVPVKIRIRHVVADTDRHGNVRIYYRPKGKPKVRLHETPGSPEFALELEAAKEKTAATQARSDEMVAGSLRAVCAHYYDSAAFKVLGASTRKSRRAIL